MQPAFDPEVAYFIFDVNPNWTTAAWCPWRGYLGMFLFLYLFFKEGWNNEQNFFYSYFTVHSLMWNFIISMFCKSRQMHLNIIVWVLYFSITEYFKCCPKLSIRTQINTHQKVGNIKLYKRSVLFVSLVQVHCYWKVQEPLKEQWTTNCSLKKLFLFEWTLVVSSKNRLFPEGTTIDISKTILFQGPTNFTLLLQLLVRLNTNI